MAIKIVKDGKELEIRAALDYLKREYAMPAGDVKAVAVEGEIGAPMLITVTVYVRAYAEPEVSDPLGLTPEQRAVADALVQQEGLLERIRNDCASNIGQLRDMPPDSEIRIMGTKYTAKQALAVLGEE
jgi:hypothetical protein